MRTFDNYQFHLYLVSTKIESNPRGKSCDIILQHQHESNLYKTRTALLHLLTYLIFNLIKVLTKTRLKATMSGRFRTALMSIVGISELILQYPNDSDLETVTDLINSNLPIAVETKRCNRPSFLGLTNEETQVSADHTVSPIVVPTDLSRLTWCADYAKCITAGKSIWNGDQATANRGDLKLMDSNVSIPYVIFSMFDGHADYQAALTARLHHSIILERLMAIPGDILLAEESEATVIKGSCRI